MAEIDLIPEDYRRWLQQKIVARNYGFAILGLVAILLVTGQVLEHTAKQSQASVERLRSDNAITQQQQIQLQQLDDERVRYERQWSLLRGLRAGAAVDDIFELIDRSVKANDIWFINWRFRRAGVIVDGEQQNIETGYFTIVDDSDTGRRQDLQVETHMAIHGQARDHQTLSTFVRSLFEQADVKDVSVQKTSLTDYADTRVVSFDMTIVLHSDFRDS